VENLKEKLFNKHQMRKFITTTILFAATMAAFAQGNFFSGGYQEPLKLQPNQTAASGLKLFFNRCDMTSIEWVPAPGWSKNPNTIPDFSKATYDHINITGPNGDNLKIFATGSIEVSGSLMTLIKSWAECSLASAKEQQMEQQKYFAALDALKLVDSKGRIKNRKEFTAALKKYRSLLNNH
jgi:hypothetical protein